MSTQQLLTFEVEKDRSPVSARGAKAPRAFPVAKQAVQAFSAEHTKALGQGLNLFFQGKEEESRLTQARRILGESAASLSDEELEVKVEEFQYLIECWMDSFERSIFSDQTLTQVMKGE